MIIGGTGILQANYSATMSKDYYTILGISKNANKEEVKKAFRKLAHQYHPDRGGGNEDKFKEISEAYSVLSDEKRRREYDSYGHVFGGGNNAGFNGFDFSQAGFSAQDFQDFDLGDIFSDFFGGTRSGARARTKRGRDISIDIELSFKEAVFGTERKVLLTKHSSCHACAGSGAQLGTTFKACTNCNGKGTIHETKRSMLGTFTSVKTCESCHGRGEVPEKKCTTCRGEGVVRQEEEVQVSVPPNINDGEMIRMSGAGEAVAGGTPGDLYIKLHIKSDSQFRREGHNILTDLNIKLSDALLGSEYSIPTLDGNITVKVPQGTSPGEMLRVRGKGVPISAGRRGDLFIVLNIKLPQKLSRKAKKLVEELQEEGV